MAAMQCQVFVRFFLFQSNSIIADLQPYFSKNKNKIALAVLNGRNKKISVCCRQIPGRRYLCRYSSGRGVARVCQLTAAAPPSVTLATATCSLWSRLHVRLTIEDGPPHTLRKYNGFRFQVAEENPWEVSIRQQDPACCTASLAVRLLAVRTSCHLSSPGLCLRSPMMVTMHSSEC